VLAGAHRTHYREVADEVRRAGDQLDALERQALDRQEGWQLEGRRVLFELSMAKLDSSNDPGQDRNTAALTAAA